MKTFASPAIVPEASAIFKAFASSVLSSYSLSISISDRAESLKKNYRRQIPNMQQ